MIRAAAVLLVALLLGGCPAMPDPDVARLEAIRTGKWTVERIAGETGETVGCAARSDVCAALWAEQAGACTVLFARAEVGSGPAARRLACAERASGEAVARLDAAGTDDDRRHVLLGRATAMLLVRDFAPGRRVEAVADARSRIDALARLPGGAPYAATLGVDVRLMDLLVRTPAAALPCPDLLSMRSDLPAGTPPPDLARKVADLAGRLDDLIARRDCRP